MTDKALLSFSVFLSVVVTRFTISDGINALWSIKYYILWECVVYLYSCISYPACKALYRHMWSVRLYHIFPHYHINGTISEKKELNMKYVFWFSIQLVPETFLILRRIERNTVANVNSSSCTVHVIVVLFDVITSFSAVYIWSWTTAHRHPRTGIRVPWCMTSQLGPLP